jgi:hypothetical protein
MEEETESEVFFHDPLGLPRCWTIVKMGAIQKWSIWCAESSVPLADRATHEKRPERQDELEARRWQESRYTSDLGLEEPARNVGFCAT